MKHRKRSRAAATVVLGVVLGLLAMFMFAVAARASSTPGKVRWAADRMHCHHRVAAADRDSGMSNRGVECRVKRKAGTQVFAVLRYDDAKAGRAFWEWFIDDGGYFAKRGHVLIIPLGGRHGEPAFERRWAEWAALRVQGRYFAA